MKLSQLLDGTGVACPPELDGEIAGITCDSRRVEPGWAFVCIQGTAQDGHAYAETVSYTHLTLPTNSRV